MVMCLSEDARRVFFYCADCEPDDAVPWEDAGRLEFIREHVKTLPVAVRLLPDIRVRTLTNYASSARQRVLAIEIQRAPLSAAERFVKRVMDIVIASLALVFFLPIMASHMCLRL